MTGNEQKQEYNGNVPSFEEWLDSRPISEEDIDRMWAEYDDAMWASHQWGRVDRNSAAVWCSFSKDDELEKILGSARLVEPICDGFDHDKPSQNAAEGLGTSDEIYSRALVYRMAA